MMRLHVKIFLTILGLYCHHVVVAIRQDEIPTEISYHCGDFLNNTLNDEAMHFVYRVRIVFKLL